MVRKGWKVREGVGKNERMWEERGGCGIVACGKEWKDVQNVVEGV